MIILSVLFVLILLIGTILATKKNLSDSLILALTFVLAVVLGPLLILLSLSRISPGG